ncbi:uncharacterized protein METZ01_LOCUS312413, partial [marine metagenome]
MKYTFVSENTRKEYEMFHKMKISKTAFNYLACVFTAGLLLTGSARAQQGGSEHEQPAQGRLNLEQCVRIALLRNSQILISQGNVQVSEAQAYGAMSNVLPRVNASLMNSSRSYLAPRDVFLQDGTFFGTQPSSSTNNVNLGFSLNQTLYNGGQSWNNIRQARQNLKNSEMGVENTKNQVIANVRDQYFNLLRTTRLKEVTGEQLKLNEEQLRRSQTMYEIGSVAKVDVLQARATIGNTRISLYNQETQVRQAKANLNTALGRYVNTPIEIVDIINKDE